MVFGGVPAERIQLNEDTFWSGGPYDPINSEALQYLPKVRQLLREGRYKEAQELADQKLMGRPRHLQAYQPLGDLRLVMDGHEHPTDYRRELDLDRAVVRVRYRIGDTTFTREAFSSAPDQVIVVRLDRARARRSCASASPWTASSRSSSRPHRAARPAHDRPLARRPHESRGSPQALPRPPGPLVRRRARVRGPDRGRGAGRRESRSTRRACASSTPSP